MFGYTLSAKIISSPEIIEKPNKIIGYNFKNTGTTIALISRVGEAPDEKPIPLFPGEAMDTRLIGGMDQTTYKVSFKSLNDSDPNSQQSELYILFFKGI
jgi:hypothetical protein